MVDEFLKSVTQAYLKVENMSSTNRRQTCDLWITSLDALPLSYRRLMEASSFEKLGSSNVDCCNIKGGDQIFFIGFFA